MSCNCTSTTTLPVIGSDAPCPETPAQCQDASSDPSTGSTLASSWLDAQTESENIVILARKGSVLTRFCGSGFIQLVNGLASVVTSVPLKLRTLWHNYYKPSASSAPTIGEPLDFKHLVVADNDGNLHGIQGRRTEDSVFRWNSTTQTYEQIPESETTKCQKGLLPRLASLELVGYAPVADNNSNPVRCLSTLAGKGIIMFSQVATVTDPGDPCDSSLASVATILPYPEVDSILKFSISTGLPYWSEDV